MNKTILTTIVITLLVVGILFGAYYFGTQYLNSKQLSAYNLGAENVIISINQQGKIPVLENSTGNYTVGWIDIKTICEGIK